MTLIPGDVILTGTPSGVGPIQSGDRLEARIQGLGPVDQHGQMNLRFTIDAPGACPESPAIRKS